MVDTLVRLAEGSDPREGMRQIAWYLSKTLWNSADQHLWNTLPLQDMLPWLQDRRDSIIQRADLLLPGAGRDDLRKRLLFLDAKAGGLGVRPPIATAASTPYLRT